MFWLSTQCTPLLFVVHVVIELSAINYMHSLMRNACQISGSYRRLCLYRVVQSAYGVCSFTSGGMPTVFTSFLWCSFSFFNNCIPLLCIGVPLFLSAWQTSRECRWPGVNLVAASELDLFLNHRNICEYVQKVLHFWGTQQKWEFTYKCAFCRSS